MDMRKFILVFCVCGSIFLYSDKKQTLNKINEQIKDINGKILKLKREKKSILNEIYKIELKYKKEKIENNKIKIQINNVQGKINKKETEKKELRLEIQKSKKKMEKIVRVIYKIGSNAHLKVFIQIKSLNQLYKNYRLFTTLIDYNIYEIEKVKESIFKLDRIKKDLQFEQTKLIDLKKIQDKKIEKIKNLKKDKLNFISNISNDKKKYLRLINELKYEAENLNTLIYNKYTKSFFKSKDVGFLKGRLIWPINGKIISSFGKVRSTRFDTYVFNNGIEIKPSNSDKIKSVFPGVVVFTDYLKGYGDVIIIQHYKNFHSLYGHCEKMFKNKGDAVKQGDVIGIVGDTGSIYGKSLYFELRKKLKVQNPLKWLRKR